jgi:hypothetical protein
VRQPALLGLVEHPVGAGEQDLADDVGPVGLGAGRDLLPATADDLTEPLLSFMVGVPGVCRDPKLAHRAGHRAQQVLLPESGVLVRGAEEPQAHAEHQGQGELLGVVPAAPLLQPRQELPAQLPDVVLHRADLPRGERRAHDVAQQRVVGLVERDEVARAVGVVRAVHVVAQRVDHLLVVTQARLHILVARHHP